MYKFEQEAMTASGAICPECGSNRTYLNASSISMTKRFGYTRHKCMKCGEIYKIIYRPVEIKKLRKDF